MIDEDIAGVEFIGINTDKQALQFCKASTAMQIGEADQGTWCRRKSRRIGESS